MSTLRLVVDRLWDGAPATPGEGVTLELRAEAGQLLLTVEAPFHGDPPPPGPPGPTPGLWEHEVVELFVVHAGGEGAAPGTPGSPPPRYTEIELGPHGHHLVLQLEGVRRPTATGLPLPYRAHIEPGGASPRWRGEARLDPALLPPPPHRVNAYAIHGVGPARRYLAMASVPGEAPDFHQLACFPRLTLPWPTPTG